ncbi:hypothetical protein [Chryseolinea sp. H1M3-3]|uniref:hypothetical protein n=1 Tax=Chryseolinea sp. H1M3-3 TaxID=3034144 RepID=UPI0023EC5276|nr:hypothetical protein [Chryseolinea sp. H1M3-3]
MRLRISGILISCLGILMFNCEKRGETDSATFTKADSLTDVYLSLQDSMLRSWNIMINDDNQKITAMHNLLHELMLTTANENELQTFEEQLDRLADLRYDQKSMAKEDLIEEYDFASNSLVTELISIAESRSEFAYNPTLQKLVEEIRIADQRVDLYREEYDLITQKYNNFLQANRSYLDEMNLGDSLIIRPLFQMTYGE